MSEPTAKVIPRSPYVEEETDEEFLFDENEGSNPDRDERICRICFSGQDEVESLGKLISPCKCRYQTPVY
jgi:RING-variant domain